MIHPAPTPATLRKRHEALWPPGGVFEPLPLRTYRAIRWWERAEREHEAGDLDVAFLLYWTSFNAAYAREISWKSSGAGGGGERADFEDYFATLLTLDRRNSIYEATFENYYGAISALLDNEYLFSPFWKHADGRPGYGEWRKWFEGVKGLVRRAIAEQNTGRVLNFLFDRLYTLRNQLVHGGATWDSSLNRESLRHAVEVLRLLLPRFLEVMLDHPEEKWEPPYYRAFPTTGGTKTGTKTGTESHAQTGTKPGASPPARSGAVAVASPVALDELARRHEARRDRDEPLTPFALRTLRAISWAQRAGWEREDGDLDVAFMLWWISFNAAYAKDVDRDLHAREEFGVFLDKLLYLDRSHAIHEAIRKDFSGAVGELLGNRYLFQPFWDDANGKRRGWRTAFEQTGNEAREALDGGDTGTVLSILFERLYTLRKQLVHGGSTWDSSLNRESVREGARLLEFLVPVFIGIMLDNPRDEWGPPHYFPGPHAREERSRR